MNTKKTKTVAASKSAKPASKKQVVVRKAAAIKKVVKKTKAMPAAKKSIEAKRTGRKKAFNIKRATYMVLSIILGLVTATFISLFLELVYMKNADTAGIILQQHSFLGLVSYLPFFAQPLLLLIGLLLGIWLGFWGWDTVYVQHRHRMFHE